MQVQKDFFSMNSQENMPIKSSKHFTKYFMVFFQQDLQIISNFQSKFHWNVWIVTYLLLISWADRNTMNQIFLVCSNWTPVHIIIVQTFFEVSTSLVSNNSWSIFQNSNYSYIWQNSLPSNPQIKISLVPLGSFNIKFCCV